MKLKYETVESSLFLATPATKRRDATQLFAVLRCLAALRETALAGKTKTCNFHCMSKSKNNKKELTKSDYEGFIKDLKARFEKKYEPS